MHQLATTISNGITSTGCHFPIFLKFDGNFNRTQIQEESTFTQRNKMFMSVQGIAECHVMKKVMNSEPRSESHWIS